MGNEKKIKILSNGPYQISGSIPFDQLRFVSDKEGASTKYKLIQKYPLQETYHLCRCGQSENKPFCDGSHANGFDGTTTASFEPYESNATFTEGKVIDLLDNEKLCAIARFCDTHGDTWTVVEESADKEAIDIVTYQCDNCPSGRLTAVTKDGKRIEPELPQEISTLEDISASVHGPIWVKGGIPVEDELGKMYPIRNRMTLCRCGRSENKPFCDGRHMENEGELDD